MTWWLWVLLGLVLLALEAFTPGGFYVLFFGVGGLVVGILVGLGLAGPPWTEWLIFSVVSIVSLALFRRPVLAWFRAGDQDQAIDQLEGEVAIPLDDLGPGAVGKAELRGSTWTVQNADAQPLAKGQRCRVTRVEGLTLWIRGEAGGRTP
jgi:membrane protein implicated in regulation of membrane protease activity